MRMPSVPAPPLGARLRTVLPGWLCVSWLASTPNSRTTKRDTVGAQWVEIEAMRMADGSALSCTPRPDAEQVLYLEDGHIDARAGEQDFHLAPGDFLFLPRGAGAALRCPTGRRASGFLIKGRIPSSPSL